MKAHVRVAHAEDASALSRLVQGSFRVHVAPDWSTEAAESFMAGTTADKLATAIAESIFTGMAEEDGHALGVILLPRPNLVQLCFVAAEHVRQGIGRSLWEAARAHVEARHPDVKTIELNASPHSVAAYAAMGFFPISKQFDRRGAVATRMACWLPGRGLERGAGAFAVASDAHRSNEEASAMDDLSVREARPSDAGGIAACVCEAYVHYVERIGKQPAPMLEDYAEVIRQHQVHVATTGDRVVGVLVLAETGEGFCLDTIAVRPDMQGKGVGRLLLEFAEAEAARQGFASIYLFTNELMTENQALYAKIGYVEYDRRVEKGYSRVFFRKGVERGRIEA